jgi:hypothetical protein
MHGVFVCIGRYVQVWRIPPGQDVNSGASPLCDEHEVCSGFESNSRGCSHVACHNALHPTFGDGDAARAP